MEYSRGLCSGFFHLFPTLSDLRGVSFIAVKVTSYDRMHLLRLIKYANDFDPCDL